jgi:hypothetical protein
VKDANGTETALVGTIFNVNAPPGKLKPWAYGLGRFRVTKALSSVPDAGGRLSQRPGICTRLGELVVKVPEVCLYRMGIDASTIES